MKSKSLFLVVVVGAFLGLPAFAADPVAPLTAAQFAALIEGPAVDLPGTPAPLNLASSACLDQPCPWVQCGACVLGCWNDYLEFHCYCVAEEPGNHACDAEAHRQLHDCVLTCI